MLWNRQRHGSVAPCYICSKFLTFDEATVDHVVARSLGGRHRMDNLQICCFKCNNEKSKTENLMPNDRSNVSWGRG